MTQRHAYNKSVSVFATRYSHLVSLNEHLPRPHGGEAGLLELVPQFTVLEQVVHQLGQHATPGAQQLVACYGHV